MGIEADIITRLNAVSAVTDKFKVSGKDLRIYPNKIVEKPTFPACAFTRISSLNYSAMGQDIDIRALRFQFDIYDKSHDGCRAAAETIRTALQRFQGGNILEALLQNDMNSYEAEPQLHRVMLDFIFMYRGV